MLSPLTWGNILKLTGTFNILLIIFYFLNNTKMSGKDKLIYLFVSIFALSCSYRSMNPITESDRKCLYDYKYVLPMHTRSFATFGEISLIIAIVLVINNVLNHLKNKYNVNSIFYINYILVTIITVANFSCWVSQITQDYMWNVIEESLWGITGSVLCIISIVLYITIKNNNSKKINSIKSMLIMLCLVTFIYTTYIIFVDVPMYYKRSKQSRNKKKNEFTQGIKTLNQCQVDTSIEEWKEEQIWMTGYFTIGVWLLFSLFIWNKRFNKL